MRKSIFAVITGAALTIVAVAGFVIVPEHKPLACFTPGSGGCPPKSDQPAALVTDRL